MYILTNVSFPWIQLTTLGSSFHGMDWKWIPVRYKQSQTGLNLGKLKTYSLSLVLQISIDISFPTIPLLSSHSPILLIKIPNGTSLRSLDRLLKPWSGHSLLLQFWPIGVMIFLLQHVKHTFSFLFCDDLTLAATCADGTWGYMLVFIYISFLFHFDQTCIYLALFIHAASLHMYAHLPCFYLKDS